MNPPRINDDEMPLQSDYEKMVVWIINAFDKEGRKGYPRLCIKHVTGTRATLCGIIEDEIIGPYCYTIVIFNVLDYYTVPLLTQYLIDKVREDCQLVHNDAIEPNFN